MTCWFYSSCPIEDEDSRNFMVQLYLEYEAPMFRTAMGILHHQQDVEDVVQTTCLALSKKVPLYKQWIVALYIVMLSLVIGTPQST